jgi:hypothetical protein
MENFILAVRSEFLSVVPWGFPRVRSAARELSECAGGRVGYPRFPAARATLFASARAVQVKVGRGNGENIMGGVSRDVFVIAVANLDRSEHVGSLRGLCRRNAGVGFRRRSAAVGRSVSPGRPAGPATCHAAARFGWPRRGWDGRPFTQVEAGPGVGASASEPPGPVGCRGSCGLYPDGRGTSCS